MRVGLFWHLYLFVALGVGGVRSRVGRGLFSQRWVLRLGAGCPAQAALREGAPKQDSVLGLLWWAGSCVTFPAFL